MPTMENEDIAPEPSPIIEDIPDSMDSLVEVPATPEPSENEFDELSRQTQALNLKVTKKT